MSEMIDRKCAECGNSELPPEGSWLDVYLDEPNALDDDHLWFCSWICLARYAAWLEDSRVEPGLAS